MCRADDLQQHQRVEHSQRQRRDAPRAGQVGGEYADRNDRGDRDQPQDKDRAEWTTAEQRRLVLQPGRQRTIGARNVAPGWVDGLCRGHVAERGWSDGVRVEAAADQQTLRVVGVDVAA